MGFRYNEQAYRLDEALEEVLDTHQSAEEPVKQAAETEGESGLKRIKERPVDVVRSIIEKKKKKTAAELILEHDVREALRESVGKQASELDSFLESAKNA